MHKQDAQLVLTNPRDLLEFSQDHQTITWHHSMSGMVSY